MQVTRGHAPGISPAGVVFLLRISILIQHHDVGGSDVDAVPSQPARAARHSNLVFNAVRSTNRLRAIVARRDLAVEKGPEGRRVDVQVRAAVNVLSQAHVARLVCVSAPAAIGVAVGGRGACGLGASCSEPTPCQ